MEKPDIHMKLMRKYREAPTWWYMSLFSVVSAESHPPIADVEANLLSRC